MSEFVKVNDNSCKEIISVERLYNVPEIETSIADMISCLKAKAVILQSAISSGCNSTLTSEQIAAINAL